MTGYHEELRKKKLRRFNKLMRTKKHLLAKKYWQLHTAHLYGYKDRSLYPLDLKTVQAQSKTTIAWMLIDKEGDYE